MTPVLFPITDYSTLQHCLKTSIQVTSKLGQEYTFVTMDLAASKITYDIQWDSPKTFSEAIIHLGVFHTMCFYMGSLGKMMSGSGFEEILTESGICANQ